MQKLSGAGYLRIFIPFMKTNRFYFQGEARMKRFFKWLGLILASLAGLIVLAGLVMFLTATPA